jgi:hypothetical protein
LLSDWLARPQVSECRDLWHQGGCAGLLPGPEIDHDYIIQNWAEHFYEGFVLGMFEIGVAGFLRVER